MGYSFLLQAHFGIVSLYNPIKTGIEKKLKLDKLDNSLEVTKPKRTFKWLLLKMVDILSVTLAAQLFIFPILLYHFNTISVTFLISNILVGLILGLIMLVGFAVLILSYIHMGFAKFVAIFLNILLEILKALASFVSNLWGSSILARSKPISVIAIYYLVLFLICTYLKTKKIEKKFLSKRILKGLKWIENSKKKIFRYISILTVFLIILNAIYVVSPKDLRIYFIDVGQRR